MSQHMDNLCQIQFEKGYQLAWESCSWCSRHNCVKAFLFIPVVKSNNSKRFKEALLDHEVTVYF